MTWGKSAKSTQNTLHPGGTRTLNKWVQEARWGPLAEGLQAWETDLGSAQALISLGPAVWGPTGWGPRGWGPTACKLGQPIWDLSNHSLHWGLKGPQAGGPQARATDLGCVQPVIALGPTV